MTTETAKYNGWTNYETWNVKLWIDNDQGSQEYWLESAQECYDVTSGDSIEERKQDAAHDLAARLKSDHEENAPELSGCYADMLNAALSEVNWHEIAENLLEDVDTEEDADDEQHDEQDE